MFNYLLKLHKTFILLYISTYLEILPSQDQTHAREANGLELTDCNQLRREGLRFNIIYN